MVYIIIDEKKPKTSETQQISYLQTAAAAL